MNAWQLRLAPDENRQAQKLANRRHMSRNDILRHALRLLVRLEEQTQGGARILLERPGEDKAVEVWVLW